MGPLERTIGLLALAALAVTLAPTQPAWACSCAEPSLEDIAEREPDAAVARIRRVDAAGGTSGVGQVLQVLQGPRPPDQVPLALDDGASCRPWVSVGETAVLTLVPDGGGWRTLECGLLDPSTGLAPSTPDPAAVGPPAVVLAGRFPGADLLTLDSELRILGTTSLGGFWSGMEECGDALFVSYGRPDGGSSVALLDLDDLEVVADTSLARGPDHETQVLGTRCADGRVDVLTATWGATRLLRLHQDVFGGHDRIELPAAEDAVLLDADVLLLRHGATEASTVLALHDVDDGTTTTLLELEGLRGYELSASPAGTHALVSGYDEDGRLVVVDLRSGQATASTTGWWQPVHRPWIDDGRLLQVDEASGGVGSGTGRVAHRVVGLDLSPQTDLGTASTWNTAAGLGVIAQVDGDRLSVLDADGTVRRGIQHLWVGGAYDIVVLGTVDVGPTTRAPELLPVGPQAHASDVMPRIVADPTTGWPPAAPASAMVIAASAAGLAALLEIRRRARRRTPPARSRPPGTGPAGTR